MSAEQLATKRKPLGRERLAVGDCVLMGMPGISMPGEWHIGEILWLDREHVLILQNHIGGAGKPYPYLHERSYVRAVGTVPELVDIQARARAAVDPLQKAVRQAEEALSDARDAVYRRLDEFAAADPLRNAGAGI